MALAEREIVTTSAGELGAHPFLITKELYYKLGEDGWFDDKKVELIDGVIYELSPIGLNHWAVVNRLTRILVKLLSDDFTVSIQNSLDTSQCSEPVPDVAVVPGNEFEYTALPQTAVVAIEVSETTLRHDRRKADNYARAAIAEYWILDIKKRRLEVYRQPSDEREVPGSGKYAETFTVGIDGSISPLAAPAITISIADLLPS